MRARILVVEDETAIADTITYALRTDGFTPLHVSTGAQAQQVLAAEAIDLVILDVGLPDTDGFTLARELRAQRELPIIFLTARNLEVDRVAGLELGADDYVTKPFSPRELTARVKAVLRRSVDTSRMKSAKTHGAFEVDEGRFRITLRGQALELSPHEYRLLKVLIQSPGRVFTREHLLALCWEDPGMSLERTVDAHVKNIRAQLKKISAEEIIVTHRGLGYSLSEAL